MQKPSCPIQTPGGAVKPNKGSEAAIRGSVLEAQRDEHGHDESAKGTQEEKI